MSKECEELHKLVNSMEKFRFPFNEEAIPNNGIYILFENKEVGHKHRRIARIGTHTGQNQLRSRLRQHFINENKDRSIFRKNIGRALLNMNKDSYLSIWELDMTTKEAKEKYSNLINMEKQKEVERQVTRFLQDNFEFVVFRIDNKEKRLQIESKVISTVAACKECKPSNGWLGYHSPKQKIRDSGLWLVNELYKESLTDKDLEELKILSKNDKDNRRP